MAMIRPLVLLSNPMTVAYGRRMLLLMVVLVAWVGIYTRLPIAHEITRKSITETIKVNDPCAVNCTTGVPCQYPDEVDFRIIVLTYNRPQSLRKCLSHVAKLDTLGDRVAVHIWIDRSTNGQVDDDTVKVARRFQQNWTGGRVCVHIQQRHAFIIGQWIDTWRPQADTKEMALIVEDDIDISPLAYRWLKMVNAKFRNVSDVCGYTLQMENVNYVKDRLRPVSNIPKSDNVFLYRLIGTWGFSPKPDEWAAFQDWFHHVRRNQSFKPYLPDNVVLNQWFRNFDQRGTGDSMWEMWVVYFYHAKKLYTVYSNLLAYARRNDVHLEVNRREPGLHFGKSPGTNRSKLLLSEWRPEFETFPRQIRKYEFNGSVHQ